MKAKLVAAAASGLLLSGTVQAAELKVLASGAMEAPYTELFQQFEKSSGHKIVVTWASTADTKKKLEDGATYDLVVTASPQIDAFIKGGKIVDGSKVDLVKARVGLAVKAGAPKPNISTGEAVKEAVLAAKSVGNTQGNTGVYMLSLFEKWGIADQVKATAKTVPVAKDLVAVVRSGEAEIGFLQVSELIHEAGIDLVGALPDEVQGITTFSGGILSASKEQAAARALQSFLNAPANADTLRKNGLSPG